MHAGVALQGVKVGEIAQVTQQHNGHVHSPFHAFPRLCGQRNAVFLLYVYAVEVGYHAEYRHSAQLFHHAAAVFKEPEVAPELVYQYAFYAPSFLRALQKDASIDAGEHASAVYVGHQHHIGLGVHGHRHVHYVGVAQVYLRNAARSLHHDGVVAAAKAVECRLHLVPQLLATVASEVVVGRLVAHRAAVEHHLRRMVAVGFEQQRVHVRTAFDARSLGLHRLGAPYFQPVGRCKGVESHVLRLERGGTVAVLQEDTAESGGNHALANVTSCACEHYRMQLFHRLSLPYCYGLYVQKYEKIVVTSPFCRANRPASCLATAHFTSGNRAFYKSLTASCFCKHGICVP